MVAGKDTNFDMIHALGKEKEKRQEGEEGGEEVQDERGGELDQRPRSMSAGASRCVEVPLLTPSNH